MTEIKFKQLQDKKWLVDEIKEKTLRQIAKEIECSYSAIVHAVKTHEIDVQSLTGGKRVRRSPLEEKMLLKKDELVNSYKNGVTLSEIAQEYRVTYFGIRKIFKSWGVDTSLAHQPKNVSVLYKHKDEITKLYNDLNISVRQIGIKYGVAYKTVRDTLIKWGIHRSGRVSKNSLLRDKQWLSDRYLIDKMSISEIATLANASNGATSSSLLHSGIQMRTVSEGIEIARVKYSGSGSGNWKGGNKKTGKGYVYKYAPDHPHATQDGYVMRHRLEMEKHLGRYLTQEEIVHHKNGVKGDDRIENLELSSDRGTHTREHFERSHITEQVITEKEQLESRIKELEEQLKSE